MYDKRDEFDFDILFYFDIYFRMGMFPVLPLTLFYISQLIRFDSIL